MNNSPLLSVCIPTFNRAPFLRQCLESITAQFSDSFVRQQVEIIVSDNASWDNTEAVVKEFQAKFPNIYYNKNSENLGFDRNALLLVEKAGGKFVWFLGDDDALFPDAIKYLLQELQNEKFKYCIVNYWGYDNKLEHPALKNPNQAVLHDQFYNRLEDFVRKSDHNENLVGLFCGLSTQLFRKDLWQNLQDKNKFIGTSAVHFYVLLIVMKNQSFALLAKPLVKARAANIRWDSFVGLDSAKARALLTFKGLSWILDFYDIPHSKLFMKYRYYSYIIKNFIVSFVKKYIFKSQKSRNIIKKILGKL